MASFLRTPVITISRTSGPMAVRLSDSGLGDSDPKSSGDDAGFLSEDDQGRLSTDKHSRWSDLDEQRLLVYKKEGKPWGWIFKKLSGRTPAAVRTRWSMIRPLGE
ncbi:hypothetical protein LSUB1_G000956 [Lachnellula subtilissima]|uniref:Myb-like domain-containing protein n=1 Tax=Lachnellula subtilissima TaxID=602034 RepID=A0A8H8UEL5_9HELO|nr:hypothetical protein LSUB1_G000956 [Lachnellula subtilissima]